MRVTIARMIAAAAVCALPSIALSQSPFPSPEAGPRTQPPPGAETAPVAPAVPGRNNELFKTLRAQCETEVACGNGNPEVCIQATDILLGSEPPDEFREFLDAQKVKISLRLLEKAVGKSDRAAGRAYDWYTKTEFFGFGNLGGYTDAYRAKELLELMAKHGYPGGPLRKARSAMTLITVTYTEADRNDACNTAKKYMDGGKLDEDSLAIAKQILDTGHCKGLFEKK